METWLAIALGGAFGAVLRGALVHFASRPTRPTETKPFSGPLGDPAVGILLANLIGCALLGAWVGGAGQASPWLELGLMTGVAGGLTTFSTLCGDAHRLHQSRATRWALVYIVATAALGMAVFHCAKVGNL